MKICLVANGGGHLTQLLLLKEAFSGHEVFFITNRGTRGNALEHKYLFVDTEENLLWFFTAIPRMLCILLKEKPALIVSTGAEIAIPVFYLAKLLGIKTIYIESFTRLSRASTSGRLAYPAADIFLVQWPGALSSYGKKAKFIGAVW